MWSTEVWWGKKKNVSTRNAKPFNASSTYNTRQKKENEYEKPFNASSTITAPLASSLGLGFRV
jgi:hypothetical protein